MQNVWIFFFYFTSICVYVVSYGIASEKGLFGEIGYVGKRNTYNTDNAPKKIAATISDNNKYKNKKLCVATFETCSDFSSIYDFRLATRNRKPSISIHKYSQILI